MIKTAIPTLLKNLDETKDLYTRHGSLVAVGGLVIGLTESLKDKDRQSLQDCFGKKVIHELGVSDKIDECCHPKFSLNVKMCRNSENWSNWAIGSYPYFKLALSP